MSSKTSLQDRHARKTTVSHRRSPYMLIIGPGSGLQPPVIPLPSHREEGRLASRLLVRRRVGRPFGRSAPAFGQMTRKSNETRVAFVKLSSV